jgi:hypothetical protein
MLLKLMISYNASFDSDAEPVSRRQPSNSQAASNKPPRQAPVAESDYDSQASKPRQQNKSERRTPLTQSDDDSEPTPRRPAPKKKPSRAKSTKRPTSQTRPIVKNETAEKADENVKRDLQEEEINERKKAIEEKIFVLSRTRVRTRTNNKDSEFTPMAPPRERFAQSEFIPGRFRHIREIQDSN